MKTSRLISILLALALALFWIAAGFAWPILNRDWYYHQARSLELDKRTGWDYATIFEAYDEMMDYLIKDTPFGTGQLKWSEEGRSHFEDCQKLFRLDFALLAASSLTLAALSIFLYNKKLEPRRLLGRTPAFWAAVFPTAVLSVFGIWALVDFDSIFTLFHMIFFPGKTNWIFNIYTDQIVLILPQEFFARAAARILAIALGGLWLTAALVHLQGRRNKQ